MYRATFLSFKLSETQSRAQIVGFGEAAGEFVGVLRLPAKRNTSPESVNTVPTIIRNLQLPDLAIIIRDFQVHSGISAVCFLIYQASTAGNKHSHGRAG